MIEIVMTYASTSKSIQDGEMLTCKSVKYGNKDILGEKEKKRDESSVHGWVMRRREESSGVMPGESEDAGDQWEQKEEELWPNTRRNVSDCQREKKRRREGGKRRTERGEEVEGEVQPHC